MRILVFGGHGMAGHVIREYLCRQTENDIWYTIRGNTIDSHSISVDVTDPSHVLHAIQFVKPHVVINAVGILNDRANLRLQETIYVNSLFPHRLAELSEKFNYRIIQISTDCVFSGFKGDYSESDIPDGISVYAKTKSLGEIISGKHVTIRTSIIGPELKKDGIGLFHWFMHQTGSIQGYRRVYWNGVTTLELARVILFLLDQPIYGLIHLASAEKTSKYDLLYLMKEVFGKYDLKIQPFDGIHSDKSLVNTRSDFTFKCNTYRTMLYEMRDWIENSKAYPYN